MQVLVVSAIVVAPADHVVATRRSGRDLQLDHARAHVGEQTHRGGTGAHARGVDDGETRERASARACLARPACFSCSAVVVLHWVTPSFVVAAPGRYVRPALASGSAGGREHRYRVPALALPEHHAHTLADSELARIAVDRLVIMVTPSSSVTKANVYAASARPIVLYE